MDREVDAEVLANVARIRPVVNGLRRLLMSAAILDLKATAEGYWTGRRTGSGSLSREPAR